MNTKKITIYLNEQKHKELKSFCAHIGLTMSFFVNLAIGDKMRKEIQKLREPKDEPQ